MDNGQIVKDFVSTWSDQKIAEVFAFNQDGKMEANEPCNCLIGVASSVFLHQQHEPCGKGNGAHYSRLVDSGEGIREIEHAYMHLGLGKLEYDTKNIRATQGERNRIFGEILSEVMAKREAKRPGAQECEQVAISTIFR